MFRKIQMSMLIAMFAAMGGVTAFAQQAAEGVKLNLYGYVKLSSAYDSSRTAYGDASFWVLPDSASGGGKSELTFSARETRAGLNITTPESGGRNFSGRIELDLCDEPQTVNKYSPRLRLAYMDVAWSKGWSLRFGQEWDTYVSFHPTIIDAGAIAYQGHLYGRHPQVKLTKDTKVGNNTTVTTKFALQHGRNSSDLDGDGQPDENAASTPSVHASMVVKSKLFAGQDSIFSISGAYGREKLNGTAHPGTYKSWMIHGGVQLPLSQHFTLQGLAWTGENLDNYLGGIGQGVNAALGTEVASYGGWGQGVVTFNKKFKVGVGYGIDDPDDGDLELMGNARVANDKVFSNFFYNFTDRMTFSVEYSHLRTSYAVSDDARNHRVEFGAKYVF